MIKDLVIFDGSNFYHHAKKLSPKTHLTDFNYRKLAELIAGSKNIKVEYCVGEIRQEKHNKKSIKMYANQQALFYNLEKQHILIKKGYMLKNKNIYHEKGVDVRIAIDIIRGAMKNEYRSCFIVSSDTDLIPAIIDAKREDKKIIYVGFKYSVSNALKANCSKTVLITKKMILDCLTGNIR